MSNKAFLVGANTQKLKYSKNDVNNIASALENYGYEITTPEEATKLKIVEAFDALSENCQQTDTLVIYFSGHGIVKQGKLHFVLADENSELKNTFNINNLLEDLDNIKVLNKLVILDCCSALASISDWEPKNSDNYLVLTASKRIERAKEIDEFEGSFFTYKICEYLNEFVPTEGKGVLLEKLYTWLEQETKAYNLTSQNQIPIPQLIGTHKSFLLGENISHNVDSGKQITQIITKAYPNYHTSSFAISSLSLNPKSLDLVFVEPVLSDKSEQSAKLASTSIIEMSSMRIKEKENEDLNKTISEIVLSGNNILFIGKKESGKTTLLYHFQNLYLKQNQIDSPKIPVYVDFSNLPQGKNRVEKAFFQSALNLGIDSNTIHAQLLAGNFLILIDNLEFDSKSKKIQSSIIEFLSNNKKNRFLITSNENLLSELVYNEKPSLGIDYDRLYIYSFQRKQIKQLVDKWFESDLENTEEITKGIIRSLDTLRLPSTPLTVSLLLIAFEHQSAENYVLINKASLIQMILELLLEKIDFSTTGIGEFDYRLKEALLSYIAYYMDNEENYKLETSDFLRVVADFFNSIGRETPQNLKAFIDTNLIRRGVLVEIDGKIFFRFGCFAEYFIAQHMIDDKDFYQEAINSNHFLKYHQEIDYLTGKQRHNKDVIKKAGEILDNLTKDLLIDGDLLAQQEKAPNITFNKTLSQKISQNTEEASSDLREKFREKRPNEQVRDEFLELVDQPIHHTDEEISDVKRVNLEDPKSQFATSLKILALSLRNCELIKDNLFKREYLRKCVNAYWNLFLLINKDIETKINSLSEDNEKDKEQLKILAEMLEKQNKDEDFSDSNHIKASIKPVFRNMTLAVISAILLENGGTPSLKKIIQEEIDDKSNNINTRFLYTLLYADLGLEGFVNNLEKLTTEVASTSFLWPFLFDKVFYYYSFSRLSPIQVQKVENLLSEMLIHGRKGKYTSSKYKPSQKSSLINDLHRTRTNIIKNQDDI